MRSNVKTVAPVVHTHEGGRSVKSSAIKELRRSVMASMLFEGSFYEDGKDHAARVSELCRKVSFDELAQAALDAREKFKLRHVPLLLTREAIRYHQGRKVGDLIFQVVQRPDELAELLALYWKDKPKSKLTAQMKAGLGRAMKKFSPHALAKYNRDADVKLRDVMFLSHVKVETEGERYTKRERRLEREGKEKFNLTDREKTFKQLAEQNLDSADTWETNLSGGADKKETFERLIRDKKLGALALLRNLRGMIEAGVSEDLIRDGLARMNTERVLPFRFITAARYAPRLEDAIEQAMLRCVQDIPKLPGKTALLIDHSGSMRGAKVSQKSEIDRFEAACALAIILRERAERIRVFAFSDRTVEVAPRRGFAMAQAIEQSMHFGGTYLGKAVASVYAAFPECERLIVITDEQSADRPKAPQGIGYIINVGTYKNGIAYGPWVSIDGWSEAVIDYIRESEADA